jgi:hypothetical protein
VNQPDERTKLFKVVASELVCYTWQRKSRIAFITIPLGETNTTYPNDPINKMLVNVAVHNIQNGTQFQHKRMGRSTTQI